MQKSLICMFYRRDQLKSFTGICLVFVLLASSLTVFAADTQYAVGRVYNDINKNGLRDSGEPGVSGVRVSNGRDIVTTDTSGSYKVAVNDDTIIFVIKPANWTTRIDGSNLPRYYYTNKPKGSPKLTYKGVDPTGPLPASVDFPLYPHKEPNRFQALFFGDTQPSSQEQVYYLAHDIVEEIAGSTAAFGVTLGDVVGNKLDLYETIVPVMGLAGIPWYNVKGNHDTNYDGVPDQKMIDETWERVFGPSYYSFDYGPVHFVALNNPYFGGGQAYKAKLDRRQMNFLRHDLSLLPKDQLVVLMMHIPIMRMADRNEIYKLLESHPNTFSISGHTHDQAHVFVTKDAGWNGAVPHHHLINGTSCGQWWRGNKDEVGIPHATMDDGTPNGYSIITFNGTKYSILYKSARKPVEYQMNIFAPDEVAAADLEKTKVVVNVFSGSEKSTVEMQVGSNGMWTKMEHVKDKDPFYVRMVDEDKQKIGNAMNSPHIWEATLPKDIAPGFYLINVRTTDMFGQTFTGKRAIRIR